MIGRCVLQKLYLCLQFGAACHQAINRLLGCGMRPQDFGSHSALPDRCMPGLPRRFRASVNTAGGSTLQHAAKCAGGSTARDACIAPWQRFIWSRDKAVLPHKGGKQLSQRVAEFARRAMQGRLEFDVCIPFSERKRTDKSRGPSLYQPASSKRQWCGCALKRIFYETECASAG